MQLLGTVQYLQRIAGIPIRVIENGAIQEYFGCDEFIPDPAIEATLQLWNNKNDISYLITPEYMFYGMVSLDGDLEKALLLGPATPFICTIDQAQGILMRIGGKTGQSKAFLGWLSGFLRCDEQRFIDLLTLSHQLVNKSICNQPRQVEFSIVDMVKLGKPDMPKEKQVALDDVFAAGSAGHENLLLNVERGKPGEVKKVFDAIKNQQINVPQISSNSLRNFKNLMIANVAYTCSHAIRGGLSREIAMRLSDYYIRQVEVMKSTNEIIVLFGKMYLDYAKQVEACGVPASDSILVNRILKEIKEHLYENITPAMIGEHLKMSVPHICRSFKKETGKTLTKYINEKKVAEVKRLIEGTELPFSHIASELGFSSQNYLQYIFKKYTGISLSEYREKCHNQ